MNQVTERVSRAVMWAFAFIMAISAARYFILPTQLVNELEDRANSAISTSIHAPSLPPIHSFSHHPIMISLHLIGGMVAIIAGLFQFMPGLRNSHPSLHRATGYAYLAAVGLGSLAALPLSFMFFDPLPIEMRARLLPVTWGFAALSITWPVVSGIALNHARRQRFEAHRAWMLRSYCLTYAAVTTRLVAPLFLLLTQDAITTTNCALLTWPLNLLFAEWFIRRQPRAQNRAGARAASAGL